MIAAMALLLAVQSVAALIARMVFGDVSPLSVGGLLVSIAGQLVSGFVSVILFVMLARIYVQLGAARLTRTSAFPTAGSEARSPIGRTPSTAGSAKRSTARLTGRKPARR